MFGSYSGIAGGNIAPSRFVVRSASSGEPVVTQAGANVATWGISQPSTRRAPFTGWDDGYAAIAGETVNVIGDGDDEASLEIAGTIAAGQPIKSDADGKGVLADTDKDHVGAIAKHSGTAGQLILVKPNRFDLAA
jgi:hypothetical protein